ncbi:MAG: acyl-CoA dehydrogenase [Alphaproteobacteria bacterium]
MTGYSAPLTDLKFLFDDFGLGSSLQGLAPYKDIDADYLDPIFEEAGKFAAEVLAPINESGDRQGSTIENGAVRTPDGWKEAYDAFVEGGWCGLPFDEDIGGMALPWTVAIAVGEMWHAANLSWGLWPLLTQGAIEALHSHGSDELKRLYLPKLVSGEWTGTMNLTEPQAGSDLALLKTRATPEGDHYRIKGQKIFITYGEHDMSENICHLVLARLPDAPAGTRGISLFLVPKYIANDDGTPGRRNDLRCVSLERKLGIHGSPTCVMAYGDNDGAIGYLVGDENKGLTCMFTMMNNARLTVASQGLAIAERTYQQARLYAQERIQGIAPGGDASGPIARHPDIRRMLLTMRSTIEAMRSLILDTMVSVDTSKHHGDDATRAYASRRVDLLTPVIKGWLTDQSVAISSLGVQIHGGMGFIEETGAAQYYRDSRILPIYEGTNGIQAADLVGRKILRDDGVAVWEYFDELNALVNGLNPIVDPEISIIRKYLALSIDTLETATEWILSEGKHNTAAIQAASTPYLTLFGITAGGSMMARMAKCAFDILESEKGAGGNENVLRQKVTTARFFAENILSTGPGMLPSICEGHNTVMRLADSDL